MEVDVDEERQDGVASGGRQGRREVEIHEESDARAHVSGSP